MEFEERLAKLERSNRWWRFIALLAFGIASLRVLIGAGQSSSFDTITANRINVVDPKGDLVGALMGQSGDGTLVLTSSKSKGQVIVGAWGDFAMQNASGKEIVSLSADDDGNGAVHVDAAHGKSGLLLQATTEPAMAVNNADGNLVAAVACRHDGAGTVQLASAAGKPRIQLDGHISSTQPASDDDDVAGIQLLDDRAALGVGHGRHAAACTCCGM